MLEIHLFNIIRFIKHVFSINERTECWHADCKQNHCTYKLSEDQINQFFAKWKNILQEQIETIPTQRVFIYINKDVGHPSILKTVQELNMQYYSICKLLPPNMFFLLEGERLLVSFEQNSDPIPISDMSRPIEYTADEDFTDCKNRYITSISTIFETKILLTKDPQLLRRYLSHNCTDLTSAFKRSLIHIFQTPTE